MHTINPFTLDRSIEVLSEMRQRAEPQDTDDQEHLDGLMNMLEALRYHFLVKENQYLTLERSEV